MKRCKSYFYGRGTDQTMRVRAYMVNDDGEQELILDIRAATVGDAISLADYIEAIGDHDVVMGEDEE